MKKILFAFILSTFFFLGNAQTLQEGIQQMENENYTGALNTFNAICKADPKSSVVYFYIGEVHYLLENYSEAEKAYRKGLTINTSCAECYVGLGKLDLDKGNTMEGEKNFALALRIDKKNASTFGHIGDAYLYSKKPNAAKAIEYLSNARDLNPKVARYWAHLGDAYQLAGDHGEAMTAYENAVEKDPKNAEAYISMARIWARAQQTELAIPKLEEAIRLSPNDARPIKDLYELYIRERQYAKVVPLLEKYVSLIGDDIEAKVRLVKFLTFQAKDYDRAIAEGERLVVDNPDQYTLYRWLAWAYSGKAKQMEEERAANKTITDSMIVALYRKAYENSVRLFDALEKDPKKQAYTEDYDIWALSALKIGMVDEAAHIYRKYLEFEPTKAADIYATLAKTYYDSANYEQAITYYKRKNELKALSNTEEYYLGQSYFQSKNYVEADSSFARVLRITPDYAHAWYLRARVAYKLDPDNTQYLAKPYFEKYVELASLDPAKYKKNLIEAYNYLAHYAVHHDNNQLAKEYYDKILAIDPGNQEALDNLKVLNQR